MSIARRVRDCRYAKGWGPDELALRAAISRTALYQIECGKTETPRAGTLRRIAEALGVPIEALLGANGEAAALVVTSHEEPGGPPREDSLRRNRLSRPLIAPDPELQHKFEEILLSPYGEAMARIIEETHRLVSTSPAPAQN